MAGFYYSLIGILFGILCSRKAKKLGFENEEWFTFGFAFNIVSYFALKIAELKIRRSEEITFESDAFS